MNTKSYSAPRLGALVTMMSLALSGVASAQQAFSGAPVQLPNAGLLLQQVPQQPATVPPSDLDLRMLRSEHRPAGDSHAFLVKGIQIVGNSLLSTDKLHALVADSEGKQLTLTDLDGLADRISTAYLKAGYPLVRVYVPAQTLSDGIVKLAVVEARYGKVVLQNDSAVKQDTLQATLAPLQAGQPVSNYALERSLLLLSDIPGAQASSAIRPGDEAGTSDLVVDVTSAPRYTGTLGMDDFGNAYTGRARLTGNFDVNGLLHRGDLLDVSAVSSGGGMNYVQGGYRYLLNGQGTTLRVGVSSLHYHLGDDLAPLDAYGSALVGSVTLTQPIIRNTAGNLYGQLEFDHKLLKDDIGVVMIDNDRQANVWVATLAGDQRDDHGVTNFNISGSRGKITYTNDLAELIDMLTSRTQGSYTKYGLSVSRLQQLGANDAIYAGYTQQWANKNLDTSEQFFLGGSNTVRGYDTGVLAGSQGNLFTAEFRHDFSVTGVPGRWQASLFADTGRVEVYKNPFTQGINSGRLSSAGIGLHWAGANGWMAMASVAKPIGNTPEILRNVDTKSRLWVQVQKGFD
ncbi:MULTISPECIES: ShlB/FhaC/HecB family hemolysin secretion/activation protein [unclassified Dyella]|uniref:ShlB/FhaC/HecB family hemolysin secretion/activation protein n=1 Tax=unclassified Dyella TaxID=2634549 RepID=UPI001E4FBFC3|nr:MULTISPECIES: ShlB/FhaC/HecB family hemolysin secretion/activation protein [unclassified Dyella]MDR3443724.1 ShlB/FhaC/HecB family hemolysin secretion/activation protein [Dyella sp.]